MADYGALCEKVFYNPENDSGICSQEIELAAREKTLQESKDI